MTDSYTLNEELVGEIGRLVVDRRQRVPQRDEYSDQLDSDQMQPINGILIEDVTSWTQEAEILPFVQAKSFVFDIAFVGKVTGGTVTLSANGNDVVLDFTASRSQIETAVNTLFGLTAPNGVMARVWVGRWWIVFPVKSETVAITGIPSFAITHDLEGTNPNVFLEFSDDDLDTAPTKARHIATLQGQTILAGRLVRISYGRRARFSVIDGCPDFVNEAGNLPGDLPVTL